MVITAAVELSSKARAPGHSVQKVRRPLVGRPAQVTAFKQRIASQPASNTGEAAKTTLASAIPKTEALPGALIEAQRKRIFYFILKHVKHHDDAEDLTQEALLQAYLSFASFQGQSSFSTWMTGIALNLVRNHVNRAPQRRYCFVDEEALHEVASDRGDPVAETQFEQLLERLEEELPKLPPALREALVLVAVRGLSYEEVAQIQKTTVENVKNRLFRARQALRETVLES
jgi:RNA polymerase sigma-70 factor (ECF subfamily)